MQIIKIKNQANYARQIQYYRTNRFIVVNAFDTVTLMCETSDVIAETNYYLSLRNKHFDVEVIDDMIPVAEPIKHTETATVKKSNDVESEHVDTDIEVDNAIYDEIMYNRDGILMTKDSDFDSETQVATIKSEPEQVTEPTEHDESEHETVSKTEYTYDDLSDQQLKQVLINMGIKSTVRARYKLIDLIELNMPEGKCLNDYL